MSSVLSYRSTLLLVLAIDKWQRDKKGNQKVMCNILRTRRYLAGHELNPNRGVKPGPHTACAFVCGDEDSQSPNLRSSAAMYLLHGNTAGAGQYRLIRSAPSRPADIAVAQNDLPPPWSMRAGPGPVAYPASRSMTSPSPPVTVMIRPADDETTTRDWRPVRSPLAQAGTSYVALADGLASGFVCKVKSLHWQRLQ